MSFMNRRRFVAVTSVTATSALLVACGNEALSDEELNPTQIPDVPGAPPTLAPKTSTPGAATEEAESSADAGDSGDTAAAGAVTVEAHDDFTFSPNEIEAAPGQAIKVVNAGMMQHDLRVDDWDLATELLNGGDEGEITVPEDAEVGSSVEFHCTVPGHKESGMFGTITVVEAGAAAPADGGDEEAEATPEESDTASTGDSAAAGGDLTIEANDDFTFNPKEADVTPGQVIKVVNAGMMQHDLVVEDWEIGTELLNGGDEGEITIPEDAEVGSSVEFHCSVPGHKESGMFGTFTVVEAGAAAPADGGDEEEATEESAESDDDAAAASGEAITINANDDFTFDPKDADVTPGQVIKVVNAGMMQHDLVVEDWEIGTELLNGGDEAEITIPDDAEVGSSVEFHCSVPGHKESGMFGTFTVV